MKTNYYITTSIPYLNGPPHIGHALEFLMADVLARSARQNGHQVLFSTGSDEHGTKVAQSAEKKNMTPKAYVDHMSKEFKDLIKLLEITPDIYVRTTDENHEKRAAIIWKALSKDIYKAKYTGWYDVKQEEFIPVGKADPKRMEPSHPQAYQRLEEENYFFKLSNYTEQIKQAIKNNSFLIAPQTRRNEILSLLDEGLEDISVSRPREQLDWGIPVPGDKNQVMYVWFEALMNYVTVLNYPDGENFKNFWPANVQVIGKDILRFHGAIWPAMLFSLGVSIPKALFVHGFITVEGQTMSKSLGNGIHPKEIVDKYGVDAFRYYFLKHIPSYDDGDFSWTTFDASYNNELANELGNVVQRTVVMIEKYQDSVIGDLAPGKHDSSAVERALKDFKFDRALDAIWQQVRGLNQYIDEEKPWVLAKSGDTTHLQEVLSYQVSCILEIAELLIPFLPSTAGKIKSIFESDKVKPLPTTLFPKLEINE